MSQTILSLIGFCLRRNYHPANLPGVQQAMEITRIAAFMLGFLFGSAVTAWILGDRLWK